MAKKTLLVTSSKKRADFLKEKGLKFDVRMSNKDHSRIRGLSFNHVIFDQMNRSKEIESLVRPSIMTCRMISKLIQSEDDLDHWTLTTSIWGEIPNAV